MASCSCAVARADARFFIPAKSRSFSSVSETSRLQTRGLFGERTLRRSRILRVQATSSASPRKRSSGNDVAMVDPLEAKRLAAQQMQEIQAKKRFKRQRQIEAINGAWAMMGLTAGLLIEAQTGDSIPAQLAGYWSAAINYFLLQ